MAHRTHGLHGNKSMIASEVVAAGVPACRVWALAGKDAAVTFTSPLGHQVPFFFSVFSVCSVGDY